MFLKLLRFVSRLILRLMANVEIIGRENVPQTGGCIVAANHLGRLDALLAMILPDRGDIVMLVAEKYREYAVWRWFAKRLDAIWLNRFKADFRAMRQVYKRLRQGEMLTIAPEGTRSQTESLNEGKHGAAYLAAKASVPIIPAAVTGTEDRRVMEKLRRFQRLDITIRVGAPFTLPPMNRKNREALLQQSTDEIMCRIGAMLPPSYRGVYADHPRLQELLPENG